MDSVVADREMGQFIARWRRSGGAERANYQLFITELCDELGVERPHPAREDDGANGYTFDRMVTHTRPDGSTTSNYIDCYKRGCFVLETKQGVEAQAEQDLARVLPKPAVARRKSGHGVRGTARYDAAMRAAYNQADRYARALPVSEGMPPFLVVVDIGHSFEIYSDFSRSGKTYVPFPDPQTFRLGLKDLAREDVRERLRLIFTDPMALDPSRHAARVTREVAGHLAELSKSLEQDGYDPERTAHFLMRCIFTMFAEDVELIPRDGFRNLLKEFTVHTPADRRLPAAAFPDMVRDIWRAMDEGAFSVNLKQKLQRFNGGLFADTEVLPLRPNQILLLHHAAACEWRDVEPAIFGTLLERALNPKERHKLGAHYTPRAYVERLVLPTVIEPLREDWNGVLAAAVTLDRAGKWGDAVRECRDFLYRLTQTLVLDPACGTGNFLYVTLDHMKRLEGEVRDAMASFTGGQQAEIEASEFQVDPHQFLGIEVNPRAAAIAELVLWIGYLQWQIKALGTTRLPEPVLRAYHNIENRDAVLDYTETQVRRDGDGEPVTRWDGETKKLHPVTGEWVPDETARVPVLDYVRARPAEWPFAHFIVGNPPFLGNKRMREALGDGYTESLRSAYPDVPGSADFVMYWWHKAAEYLRWGWRSDRFLSDGMGIREIDLVTGEKKPVLSSEEIERIEANPRELRRFGFITTNSLRQTFNRRVLQHHMGDFEHPISLAIAIPDHPWVDSSDGAAVRISITVTERGTAHGILYTIAQEDRNDTGTPIVAFASQTGLIHPNLTVGAATASAMPLQSNRSLSTRGVALVGDGFLMTAGEATRLDLPSNAPVRNFMTGRDLTRGSRELLVIDLFGLSEAEVLRDYPVLWQWVSQRVRPEREAKKGRNKDADEYARNWWLFAKPRQKMRLAHSGLRRYIGTSEVAKYRVFTFLPWPDTIPEGSVIAVALEDAFYLGVLSSMYHIKWSLATGGTLEDRPRYNNSVCFETFPFPTPTPEQAQRIRDLAERLDGHRKRQQALYPGLTLTDCYNVLEKLRSGEALSAKDRRVHEEGLVTVLRQLHDELDAAVAEAYGWPPDLADEEILQRLVDLNRERAQEEAQGLVRWLRPEFQNPAAKLAHAHQDDLLPEAAEKPAKATKRAAKPKAVKAEKLQWPKTLPEQAKAVQAVLREREGMSAADVAARFSRGRVEAVEPIIETLEAMGWAR